ncbi:MAG: SGNH/GDSL hydrolase family protein [Planctomycetes bacterium]|nr:SGNH/GDSL hydrolase family protein [Planctomycetota bacterium]
MNDTKNAHRFKFSPILLCSLLILTLWGMLLIAPPSAKVAGGGRLPTAVYLALVTLIYLTCLFVVFLCGKWLGHRRSRPRLAILAVANIVIALAFCEGMFFVLNCRKLAENPNLARLSELAVRPTPGNVPAGSAPNYQPHHYLNYVLNPDVPYMGTLQYNAKYFIRRERPILPRGQSALRILALGGSTTFCDQIANEEDTWPARLESLLRSHYGEQCEVINGGVGGYNLLENMLHYVTLLSDLDPDVVLLYEGINDVHPRLYPTVEFDYSKYRYPWRLDSQLPTSHRWLRRSSTYDYFFTMTQLAPIASTGIHDAVSLPYPDLDVWSERLVANPPTHYRDHLEDFVQFLQGQCKSIVIIPQYFIAQGESDLVFAEGVEQNNRVNAEVAESFDIAFLSELLQEGAFAKQDLFDNCHFNEQGNQKMANIVLEMLQREDLVQLRL